jgi:membrane protease YdiL (CAAX protease family)
MSFDTNTRSLGELKGEIVPPTRSAPLSAVVILTTIAFFIVLPLLGRLPSGPNLSSLTMIGGPALGYSVLGLTVALVVAAFLTNDVNAKTLAVMVFAFVTSLAGAALIGGFIELTVFPVIYLISPAIFVVLVITIPGLKDGLGWLRIGRFSPRLSIAVAVLAAISTATLVGYVLILTPDLTQQPLIASHRFGVVSLFLVGICIAALNAAVEEGIYRGIVMNALDAALGPGWWSVALQAVAFGTFHFNSTEPGVAGVFLTAMLGLVLGTLRRFGRGMAPNYLLHVVIDIGVWILGMTQLR